MDFVEQLKSSIDIVPVIGEYVRLRRVGATGRWTGLCPFHQEKTPSFSVNQTRQFYKCFGCGVSGDALKFVMDIDGLTFPETLKLLAERFGIPMPKRTEYADAKSKLHAALMEMHVIATQVFQANLRSEQGSAARDYLARRGVSAESIETFQLGYSDSSGQTLVRRLSDFSAEQLGESGLVKRRQEGSGFYDAFRGRLMFPIHNESGKVIAFGGRAMRKEDQPKYLNSGETPIYRKSSVLYNLHRAREGMRKSDRAVLVEGYMDVIGVHSAGIKEVVASCGTALTNAQVRTIHRHTDTVIVNFDPDGAGSTAAERAIPLLLDEGLHVKIVEARKPEIGLDPDQFVKEQGKERYIQRLLDRDSARPYFYWLADRARARFDMKTTDGRMDVFKFLLPAVQKLPDKLERAAVANDLASYLDVDAPLVLDQFKRSGPDRKTGPAPATRPVSIPALEKILLSALVSSEGVRTRVLDRLTMELTAAFVMREIFEALRQMAVDNGPVAFGSLEGRLSPQGQTLLHEAFVADETVEESVFLEQAEACLRRLESDAKRRAVDQLRAAVKLAEREGRLEEAIHLMAELLKREKE